MSGVFLTACVLALSCALPAAAAPIEVGVGARSTSGDELSKLRAAYRSRPGDPGAGLALGLFLQQRDRTSLEAQSLLDAASRRYPERSDVHLKLLDSYLARGNAAAAQALLARLQPAIDSSTRFAFDVCYSLLQNRQFPLAQAQWQRVSERVQKQGARQDIAEAAFIRGLMATAAGEKQDALSFLRRADSLGFPPLSSPQILMLADAFYWLEEYNLAAATYTEALAHFPKNPQARLRLGASLYWSSQPDKARQQLEMALRQNPRLSEANFYLGAAFFALKANDKARACFEKELALDPRCDRCMSKLAYMAYMTGDDQAAASWVAKAVALSTATPETDLVNGMIANRAGRYEEAIRYLSKVVARFPQHAQAQFQLATAYQRSGEREQAQRHFDIYKKLSAAESAPSAGAGR